MLLSVPSVSLWFELVRIDAPILGAAAPRDSLLRRRLEVDFDGMSAVGQNSKASADRRAWEQREAANYAANRDKYDRAFGACMTGRGYSMK